MLDDGIYSLLTIQTAADVLNVPPRWLRHRLDSGEVGYEQESDGKRRYLRRDEVERVASVYNLTPVWERALG